MKIAEKVVSTDGRFQNVHHRGTQLGISITAFVVGVICMAAGAIALASLNGKLPPGSGVALKSFSKMGPINAYILFFGGGALTLMSAVALTCISRNQMVW
jgi:hypothetical protein